MWFQRLVEAALQGGHPGDQGQDEVQALRADWPLGPGMPPEQEPVEVGRRDEVCQEDDDQAGKIECEDFLSLCATIEEVKVMRMA